MSGPQIASRLVPSSLFLTQGTSLPKPKRMMSSIRIFTRPVTPRTSRTTSDALPRGGMKSMTATLPPEVSKRVSRISVLSR